MRFVLYSDKTVNQCLSAINERIQSKSTMDGWTNKEGTFSISLSSKVAKRFTRTTRLYGKIERESGVTIIQGNVSHGAGRQGQLAIFGALVVLGLIMFSRGSIILAVLAVLAGSVLFIPLIGDDQNSTVLLRELRSLLKARETPPKKPSAVKSAAPKSSAPPKASVVRPGSPGAAPKKPMSTRPPGGRK